MMHKFMSMNAMPKPKMSATMCVSSDYDKRAIFHGLVMIFCGIEEQCLSDDPYEADNIPKYGQLAIMLAYLRQHAVNSSL